MPVIPECPDWKQEMEEGFIPDFSYGRLPSSIL